MKYKIVIIKTVFDDLEKGGGWYFL